MGQLSMPCLHYANRYIYNHTIMLPLHPTQTMYMSLQGIHTNTIEQQGNTCANDGTTKLDHKEQAQTNCPIPQLFFVWNFFPIAMAMSALCVPPWNTCGRPGIASSCYNPWKLSEHCSFKEMGCCLECVDGKLQVFALYGDFTSSAITVQWYVPNSISS